MLPYIIKVFIMRYIPIILFSVMLNALAQIFLKRGVMHFENIPASTGNLLKLYLNAATNYYVLGGLLCYGVSVLTWMFVLSKTEVSYAYPFLSIGYILSAIAGYYFFQEHISFSRMLGIAIICVGVIIIAKS